ncbi:NIPSNAP family protein [Chloroflexi bacterium TSY]|nr:NIPSNAP family protein [Chloroflexi bacterium TSY]
MFFELRQYRVRPGKMDEWVQYMEEVIMPFQIARGMNVVGSFTSPEEDDLYIWIRRFENESEKEKHYAAVYQDNEWVNVIGPKVGTLLDREKIKVTVMEPTSRSAIH